jgi:membrane protease YdiL (CAAX protease family)
MYEPDPDALDDEALDDAPVRSEPPDPGHSPEAHRRARVEALAQLSLALGLFVGARVGLERAGLFDVIASRAPGWEILTHVFMQAAVALLVVAGLLRASRAGWSSIGLGRPAHPWRELGRGLGAVVAVYLLMIPLVLAAALLIRGPGQDAMTRQKLGALRTFAAIPLAAMLPVALVAGLYEEIFVRGFLHARLARLFAGAGRPSPWARGGAVVLGSVLFGLAHVYQGPIGVVQTAVVGLVFGFLSAYWRTVWPAVVAHVAIDTFGLVASRWLVPAAQRMILERMQ